MFGCEPMEPCLPCSERQLGSRQNMEGCASGIRGLGLGSCTGLCASETGSKAFNVDHFLHFHCNSYQCGALIAFYLQMQQNDYKSWKER